MAGAGQTRARRERRHAGPVSLALVQHAHQYLITDGYENREGISQILDAFSTVLALHLKYRVPLNLHASGMLLEAVAWHRPIFFDWIAALRREGLLEVIGSAYAQNIMPLFADEHNGRQLREGLGAYRRFLGVDPCVVRGFWVPERVWNTTRIAHVLRDASLPNGGYRYVLLDDRLAYPSHTRAADPGPGERRSFDRVTAPARGGAADAADDDIQSADHLHAYRVAGADGLVAFPISVDLRYSVPPREGEQWSRIRAALRRTARAEPDAIAVFADDLERSAAVGPWTSGPWRRASVSPYERFLRWIASERRLDAVLLSDWLDKHPPTRSQPVDPGTYYELAYQMHAGETYSCWWEEPAWRPYRELLTDVERLLESAPRDAPQGGLWDLAWKQLMASSFETAWHDVAPDGKPRPAPWARACASHARSVFAIAAAAEWEQQRDGGVHLDVIDVDHDGEDEVVLRNDHLFAVIAPGHGGRLVYLFDLTIPGGRLVVGNPADDWNWQEELNQYMIAPPNHPGGFADAGHENDRYRVRRTKRDRDLVQAILVDRERGGALLGAGKIFRLRRDGRSLEVEYRLPRTPERFRVECCLSPDYLSLLRCGRRQLARLARGGARGWRNGDSGVWLRVPKGERLVWDVPRQPECGHGLMLCVAAYAPRFRLEIGTGALPPARPRSRQKG